MERDFQKMKNNQLISFALNNYYHTIKFIAKNVKYKYARIPLEWEDLFNIFLVEVPKLLRKFDLSYKVKLSTYINAKALFIMANYARKYITKNSEILNNYINFDKLKNLHIFSDQLILKDVEEIKPFQIDITNFTQLELKVYRVYFLEGQSIKKSAEKLTCPTYTITNATKRIRKKIYNQKHQSPLFYQ